MTEIIQESLLDNLLKSHYPLTDYLRRQQEFVKIFSTTQINTVPTSSESETNVIRKRKTLLTPYYNKSDAIDRQAPEFFDAQNGISSDQDYNTAHDRSSETDDDATQEYDARPLLNNANEKNALKHC